MRLFEILCLINLIASIGLAWSSSRWRAQWLPRSAAINLVFVTAHLWLDGHRWQMVPTYVLVGVYSLVACIWRGDKGFSETGLKAWFGYGLAVLHVPYLLVAASLPLLLPVFQLPLPRGPHAVGTTWLHLMDHNTQEVFTKDPDDFRELMVRVWYPAHPSEKASPTVYRENAKQWSRIMGEYAHLPRFMFSHLNRVKTHAYSNVPFDESQASWPVLIFSHGLTDGDPSQNTALMEELASQGFVIFSIGHTYETLLTVFPDGRVMPFKREVETAFRSDMERVAKLRRDYQQSQDPALKRDLLLRKHQGEKNINRSVAIWSKDTSFVIDELERRHRQPGFFFGKLNLEQIGAFGMSFGGCATGQAMFDDPRIVAGVNLDGYPFGDAMTGKALTRPFMLMQAVHKDNDETAFIFENASASAYKVWVDGTTHLSYTDVVIYGPFIKATGLTGRIDGYRMLYITATYTSAFFNQYLKGEQQTLLKGPAANFPEVVFSFRDGTTGK